MTACTIASAMSSGRSTSPICSRERSIVLRTSGFVLWPWSSVSTKPGATIVTRIPTWSASWRSASEKACTPNLVML